MPPMPTGDPWRAIQRVLQAEEAIRAGHKVVVENLGLSAYWEDLVRLLLVYQSFRNGKTSEIAQLKKKMTSDIYGSYIEQKRTTARGRTPKTRPGQLSLFMESTLEIER